MRFIRSEEPQAQEELWGSKDVINNLNCDEMNAEKILKEVRKMHSIKGYADVPKALILDYLNEKKLIQQEREDRHKADINIRIQTTILEDHVKSLEAQRNLLEKMCEASKENAKKARHYAFVANVVSILTYVLALLAFLSKYF